MIEDVILHSLIGALTGIWAFLWTGPLSEPGMVFGPVKARIYNDGKTPEWLYLPLIGCAKCSAFWWAALVSLKHGVHPEIFIMAVFAAYKLDKQNG